MGLRYTLLLLAAMAMAVAQVQAATDCTSTLSSIAACSPYLSNSTSVPDEKTCCQPLKTVLDTPDSFQCICAEVSSTSTALAQRALLLPSACKLGINVTQANCTSSSSSPSSGNSTSAGSPAGLFGSSDSFFLMVFVALVSAFAAIFL